MSTTKIKDHVPAVVANEFNTKSGLKVMNVLFDDRYGGPQKRVIQVAKKLLSDNIETVVCLPDRGGDAGTFAEDAGLTVTRQNYAKVPNPKSLRQLLAWLIFLPRDIFRFKRLFKLEKPDIIHVNGAFFIQPAIAARLSAVPLIWHLNDTIVPGRIARILGKFVKALASRIVVAADAVAHHYGIDSDYTIIYAPVDVEKFASTSRWEDAIVSDNTLVKVGLIANWNPIKGVEYFLQAASRLISNADRRYEFILAGKKLDTHIEYCRMLEDQIKDLDLAEHITMHGFVASVEELMSDLDIVVMSSVSEACPMTVLEGMASGVPVVASNVGGVCELLLPDTENSAGKVVDSRDPEALANAIDELVENKEKYKNMGYNGRKMAKDNFSLQICVKRHRQIYKDMMDDKPKNIA